MSSRVKLRTVLACSVILLTGCAGGTKPDKAPADLERVTIHVQGITERLGLT